MRVVVFDVEIKDPVEEMGGWNVARNGGCGVSCVVLWDSTTKRYHIYGEENIGKCIDHLNQADLLVSFNGKGFDIPCLEGYTGQAINVDNHYDILAEIWSSTGKKFKGWGLGKTCARTINLEKTDTGEHAPQLVREGRWATLIDYCLNDVHITAELFKHIALTGYVIDPDGEKVFVELPGDVDDVLW